ncbi:MAG TPA: TetR/AcrR family transcriptional regulator [Devosiaceae bacterium]
MRKPAAERKVDIVATAIDLADKVGPDRITTEMIASQIGVTQATVFRHFPRKEDIWHAVAVELTARMRAAWAGKDGESDDPVARLEAAIVGQFKLIRQMPALPAILLSRELHAGNMPLRMALMQTMRAFQQRLTALVEQAIAAGRFRHDLNAGDAALLLIGLVQSVALRWTLGGRSEDLVATGRRLLAVQISGFTAGGNESEPVSSGAVR